MINLKTLVNFLYPDLLVGEPALEGGQSTEQPTGTDVQAPQTEVPAVEAPAIPQEYEIDGEKYTAEQLKEFKKGYLRQSDYTKKTQEVAAQRKEHQQALEVYEFLQKNPELLKQMSEYKPQEGAKPNLPVDKHIQELDIKLKTIEIEGQLNALKQKDPDMDEIAVLNLANEKSLDLETAYHIHKGRNFDTALKKKLDEQSAKLTDNIKKNAAVTKTLITPVDKPQDNFGLSQEEIVFAAKVGMTPEEYAKWK
jgi:hypothetical protein